MYTTTTFATKPTTLHPPTNFQILPKMEKVKENCTTQKNSLENLDKTQYRESYNNPKFQNNWKFVLTCYRKALRSLKMEENIMEEREERMVSPFGGNPFLRTAHFLKPISENPSPLLNPSKALNFDVRETPLKVRFRATTSPQDRWKEWVYKLLPKYQDIWKSAGIYDSILNSTYRVIRHNDLILALAERWNVETKTFVFPWGESTVTLEDMIVLGGYSVLGDYVMIPLSTIEMKRFKEKLIKISQNIKLGTGRILTHLSRMNEFVNNDDELTHIAFLSLWLSRYVFPTGQGRVVTNIFPIAIHLSFGTRLALAPTVLAMVYEDLTLLKKSIISSSKRSILKSKGVSTKLDIRGLIYLVQIWAWERFPTLRPSPNPILFGESRWARWHDKKQLEVDNLREALDSAGQDFQWRPYCVVVNNWNFNEFYRTNGGSVTVEHGMDEHIESFAICIRPSELVGLGGSIEQYLPHRVAMQFGYDQDIPGFVPRFSESPDSAWDNFKRPIGDKQLYIPPRLFESDVTFQYLSWWNRRMSDEEDRIERKVEKGKLKTNNQTSKKRKNDEEEHDPLDGLTIGELLRFTKKTNVAGKGVIREDKCSIGDNSSVNSSRLALDISGIRASKDMVVDHMDGSSFVVENANDEGEFPSWYEPLKPGMELEDRISRLERLAGKLKARTFRRSV